MQTHFSQYCISVLYGFLSHSLGLMLRKGALVMKSELPRLAGELPSLVEPRPYLKG